MMQLTEQFAQQHYRNIVSQATPTVPLLNQQQQLSGYAPTSLSYLGIPILMGTTSSTTRRGRASSTRGRQVSLPGASQIHLTRPSATFIASPSLSVTSQTQATSTVSQLTGLQVPPGLQMPHAYPLTMPSQTLPLVTQSLQCVSVPHAPALTRSSQSVTMSSHSPTAVLHADGFTLPRSVQARSLSSFPSNKSSVSTASLSTAIAAAYSSPSQYTSPSSTIPTVSSQSQVHVSSCTTQTSPMTPMVSSPAVTCTCTTSSTEASQLQGSAHRQGQTTSVSLSTTSQAPTDQVVFPKGPSFITIVRRLEPVAFLRRRHNTVPSSSSSSSSNRRPNVNMVSSHVQPHASLLAPEFGQSSLSSIGTATVTRTSITRSVSRLSRTPGDTPYPSFGTAVFGTATARNFTGRAPSTSISLTSVTVSSPPRTQGNFTILVT